MAFSLIGVTYFDMPKTHTTWAFTSLFTIYLKDWLWYVNILALLLTENDINIYYNLFGALRSVW